MDEYELLCYKLESQFTCANQRLSLKLGKVKRGNAWRCITLTNQCRVSDDCHNLYGNFERMANE